MRLIQNKLLPVKNGVDVHRIGKWKHSGAVVNNEQLGSILP
jgi:hypothetical protein